MNGFRRLAATHRWLAALIVSAGLMLRLAAPAGFMPVVESGRMAIVLCSGVGPESAAEPMRSMPHAGMREHAPADPGKHAGSRADAPCAFAGLPMPALPEVGRVLLALTVLFATLAAVSARPSSRLGTAVRLRPPLRAPPAG